MKVLRQTRNVELGVASKYATLLVHLVELLTHVADSIRIHL